MDVVYLDLQDIKEICHPIAVAYFDLPDDPIPPFGAHEIAKLDSALALPRQAFGGQELYPTLPDKAAILFYGLIQNHAFQNGNKRIATASLLVFLHINNYLLSVDEAELAKKAIDVASAGERNVKKDEILPELGEWITRNIIIRDQKGQ